MSRYYSVIIKRPLDALAATIGLVVLSPLLLFTALLIRLTSPGPILYCQLRMGIDGHIFTLYKFRTMSHKQRLPHQQVYVDNPEVTAIGRVLRRLKIDELPQLWNVLTGDMALVGPRPCLPEQLTMLDDNGRFRLLVRPGLTGLAQVNGNIHLSWPERWKYDRHYVEHMSLSLDMHILVKTLMIVTCGEGRFVKEFNET